MAFTPIDPEAFSIKELDHEFDRVTSQIFLGSNAAFLGSLMCALQFHWSEDHATAATNGESLWWNPKWFMKLPVPARCTVLKHELWHAAMLHGHRCGIRDPLIWNYACDIWINNNLETEGCSFIGLEGCWLDQSYAGLCEEEIYEKMMANNIKPQQPLWGPGNGTPGGDGQGDILPADPVKKHAAISNVVRAVQQAKLSGGAGSVPAGIEKILDGFLKPIIPWQTLLKNFFGDLIKGDYTWRRPNRRYPDIYMPSRNDEENRLEQLNYYQDVSGSVDDKDVLRFNSELKFVKDQYNPKIMKMIQFTTRIIAEDIIDENDKFEKAIRKGSGGTSLVGVREHIIKDRPTAAIIFSDLECTPMEPLPFPIPIIWVVVGTRYRPPFGKWINIQEER